MKSLPLQIAALVLLAPDQPSEPPSDDTAISTRATESEPRVSDTALHAVEGEEVQISDSAGRSIVGRLKTFGDDVVVLVQSDGKLVEVARTSIESVGLAEAAPQPPLATAVPVGMCTGDAFCEDPRVCIDGQCRVPPGYTDELRKEAEPRIKHGR
jgi:hypothetical protein